MSLVIRFYVICVKTLCEIAFLFITNEADRNITRNKGINNETKNHQTKMKTSDDEMKEKENGKA
jgi:hypothetical protein